MDIRPLVDTDIPLLVPAIAAQLRELALEFIVHESTREGAATFLAENDQMGVRKFLALGHVYHVALDDGQLAGFIAILPDESRYWFETASRPKPKAKARRRR